MSPATHSISFIRAAAITAGLLTAPLADAAPPVRYVITDLGIFPGGETSRATSINNAGQIVGVASLPQTNPDSQAPPPEQAFLYTKGTLIRLGSLAGPNGVSSAEGINAAGQITGYTWTSGGPDQAFIYQNNSMTPLGGLEPSNNYSYGYHINNAGQIVGDAGAADGGSLAFLYQNGAMSYLNPLPGDTLSHAIAINNAGQILGMSSVPNQIGRTVLYTNGQIQNLGNLGLAADMNDSGQIVGNYSTASNHTHAYRYSGGKLKDLGVLKAGPKFNFSTATAINNKGQIVGVSAPGVTSDDELKVHAFLYEDGRMTDLTTLTDPKWDIGNPVDINDVGQIIATGSTRKTFSHAILLTPLRLAPAVKVFRGNRQTTHRATFVIRGTAAGNVNSLTYRSRSGSGARKIKGTRHWRIPAHLKRGANIFIVTAHGERGDSPPITVRVTRN